MREIDENLSERLSGLEKFGPTLIDNGYQIVPILRGKKAPGFDGWQKTRSDRPLLKEWLNSGHKHSGVGILTKHTPAIDLDIYDDDVSDRMRDFCLKLLGQAPIRVGRAPKQLLLYRTNTPFRKMTSPKYKDQFGDEHRIEILADGQQCVAFHVHPDTNKPYEWVTKDSPATLARDELTEVTEEQMVQVIEKFNELAEEEGWEMVKKGRVSDGSSVTAADNPWIEDTQPVTMDIAELRNRLMLVPDPDADYEQWLQVGMALYHQFDGGDEGKELWHEWSEAGDKYDREELERKWGTFNIRDKKMAPVTARLILQLSKEAVDKTTAELGMKLRDAFINSKTLADWEKARGLAREAEIDGITRSSLATIAKQRRDEITGTKVPLAEIKKAIAYSPKAGEETPKWAAPWVYNIEQDRFFSTTTKISATQQGFNAMYDRYALTKKDVLEGKSNGSAAASDLALNLYRIPVVVGQRYEPGRDAIFTDLGDRFVNTYAEHEIPERPEKLNPRDKRNIERIKAHISHLLPDPREASLFMDWLSWVVQNPGDHANYSVLLQGVQGDGKTFFAEMMREVMGVSNVKMLNAHIFHSDFTDWAEGSCLNCVEEVRLVNDKNKYEILNRIKPYITNKINEIHPKGRPVYNCKNTASYLLFTNYKDAIPIDDNDRRYLVLFSQWQRKDKLDAFRRANPKYYEQLYAAIEQSAGAIRGWLLDHEQDENFSAKAEAPETEARKQMIRKSKPGFIQFLDELIEEGQYAGIAAELVDATKVSEIFATRGEDMPPAKTLVSMLERDGYESLGRIRLGDEKRNIWSKNPEKFQSYGVSGPSTDSQKVRKFLDEREIELDDEL